MPPCWHGKTEGAHDRSAPTALPYDIQVQAELGPGHINLINVYELILSDDYLGLVMEYAQAGSLTAHVAERWGTASAGKLVMDEDEARYFFRVSTTGPCKLPDESAGVVVLHALAGISWFQKEDWLYLILFGMFEFCMVRISTDQVL